MAIPKSMKGKIAEYAAKDAAEDMDSLDMEEDSDKVEKSVEMSKCPKCGYKSESSDFEME